MSTPRLALNRRTVTVVVVIVALVLGVGVWWWDAHRGGLRIRAVFSSAVGIYPGNEVRILDVPVGEVDSVTPDGRTVMIDMTLDRGISVRADTYAVIVAPNLVSDRYVELTGAYAGGPKLANGTTLGLSHTRTPVELDQLYRGLTSLLTALGPEGANRDGALTRLLEVGASNLAGNGSRINSTITALSRSSRTLGGSQQDIFATLRQLSTFSGTLAQRNKALTGANRDLAAVTQTLADDRGDFAEAVHELAGALLLVKQFVQAHRSELAGNVQRLSAVATSLGRRRESLAKALESAPLLLENFLAAYDPSTNELRGRADLNEITVWARQNASDTSTVTSGATSRNQLPDIRSAPSGLLPAVSTTDVP